MTIKWSKKADADLKRIFKSFEHSFNKNYAKDLVNELENRTLVLIQYPEIGQIENLLSFRKENFRYLVEGNYKIFIGLMKMLIELSQFSIHAKIPKNLKI